MSESFVEGAESYVVQLQERGEIALPDQLRQELDLKSGDLFTLVKLKPFLLIAPRRLLVAEAAEELMTLMAEQGLTAEALIDGLETEAEHLFDERYGQ